MPIPVSTNINAIPALIASNISTYNTGRNGVAYNSHYNNYITARNAGIITATTLSGWIASGTAANAIIDLLTAYGMDVRNSRLVTLANLNATLSALPAPTVNYLSTISLPLEKPPSVLINPMTGNNLSTEICIIYNALFAAGAVTASGGFVAASKTMHCLFPNLAPMIDGEHTGISFYNIERHTYTPPLVRDWAEWIGHPINGVPNPSPRGAGRNGWRQDQFLAAIGISQKIYELWNAANGGGITGFLALDKTMGTTGIPRVIDKILW